MKILFITHKFFPDIGGIEINSEILADEFYEAGHQVHVITWSKDPGNKPFPYKVIRFPGKVELLKEHLWADVVFENNPSLQLSWPAFFLNKATVVAVLTWIARVDGKLAWQDKLKHYCLKRASAVIAISEAIKKRSHPNAIVIGNPYRDSLFRSMYNVNRVKDFVFMGRLVSDKGADMAVKAFYTTLQNAEKDKQPLSLTIIGDGPERESLEKLVSTLGITDNVYFTGTLKGEALVECLNQHRFLLVPSVWEEPFGNVALEGMACGCLPIVSDGGGLPDAIGNAGITFKRGDEEDLVRVMQLIMENPEMEAKLKEKANDHLSLHLPKKVAHKYLEVIQKAKR